VATVPIVANAFGIVSSPTLYSKFYPDTLQKHIC